jgi:hypothetical protein
MLWYGQVSLAAKKQQQKLDIETKKEECMVIFHYLIKKTQKIPKVPFVSKEF